MPSPITDRGGVGASRARFDPTPTAARRARARGVNGWDRAPIHESDAEPARPHPSLRLVNDHASDTAPHLPPRAKTQTSQPITHPSDPRWVLAVRTAEQLEGTLLSPEKRQRLIRTGRVMGLTPFDCNLVIAIVQDQARRGHAAAYCPTAGAAQLSMVPRPTRESTLRRIGQRPVFLVSVLVTTVLMVELMMLRWFF